MYHKTGPLHACEFQAEKVSISHLHFLLILQIWSMKVGVKEHHSKGEGDNGVLGLELGCKVGVALGEPLAEDLHDPLNLLRLAGDPDVSKQFSQGLVDPEAAEVKVLDEAGQDFHGEGRLEVAQVLAHLLLGQSRTPLVEEP